MRKIGRGWQYTTYDLGNGRVLKKYNSKLVAYPVMLRDCFPFLKNPIWKLPGYYRGCKETAVDSMRKISTTTVAPWMMGNPKVLNVLDYEQDKITTLHDLDTIEIGQVKKVIDDFVEINKVLVDRNLIDKSFNITKNFGLDSTGRVILMDLGELYSSTAAIDKQRKERAWSKHYVVGPIKNTQIRSYFIEQMDKNFKLMA
jgi:hypothetical protein